MPQHFCTHTLIGKKKFNIASLSTKYILTRMFHSNLTAYTLGQILFGNIKKKSLPEKDAFHLFSFPYFYFYPFSFWKRKALTPFEIGLLSQCQPVSLIGKDCLVKDIALTNHLWCFQLKGPWGNPYVTHLNLLK